MTCHTFINDITLGFESIMINLSIRFVNSRRVKDLSSCLFFYGTVSAFSACFYCNI